MKHSQVFGGAFAIAAALAPAPAAAQFTDIPATCIFHCASV